MSYTFSRPSPFQRSGLLSLVIGLHAGVFLLILAAKTVMPQIMEMPLVVDLLQPAIEKAPEAKPLPVSKPQPMRQKATPENQIAKPPLEATQSVIAAPAAPVALATEEARPAPAGPAAEAVSEARFDVDYLRNPAPAYPPLSRRMGEEGKVILRVSVNAEGLAENVNIKTSSGSQRLDDAAVNTVRRWKFIPAKRSETPIQSWVLVPIIFKLEK